MLNITTFIEKLENEQLWMLYPAMIKELKKRELIETRNLVGEYGEFRAINYYNNTVGLPKLQKAPAGTKNVDALSRDGDRYSIKTITFPNKTTGVFYGLHPIIPEIATQKVKISSPFNTLNKSDFLLF